jgi:hypothetical protein
MLIRAISRVSGSVAVAVLLVGCVTSVNPIVRESSATWDPRLLGTGEEASGSDRVVISQASERMYAVEYASDGSVVHFGARLGSLGDRAILDLWPTSRGGQSPAWYTDLG